MPPSRCQAAIGIGLASQAHCRAELEKALFDLSLRWIWGFRLSGER